jgi:cell division protein FtsB
LVQLEAMNEKIAALEAENKSLNEKVTALEAEKAK